MLRLCMAWHHSGAVPGEVIWLGHVLAPRYPPGLRLGNSDTRIRGMNIAANEAREYLKRLGKARGWPAHIARLVDANLSLMAQRIMAQVRRAERRGEAAEAERLFEKGMREVGTVSAKEYLSRGH